MTIYAPHPFVLAGDGVDPALVPVRRLGDGNTAPAVGLGTFGSDRVGPDEIAEAVKGAISVGYRLLDLASVYLNEKEIGQALKQVFDSGVVKREELFIVSKVWNDRHGDGDVLVSCAESLRDLGLDYLDMYVVHWPFPNYHAPFCDGDSRNPDSRPFFAEEFMAVWRQMERLKDLGLVRSIATSNMTEAKLREVLPLMKYKPALNEMELHPHFQQRRLFDYLIANGITPLGFCPLGSPGRPDRDVFPGDTADMDDPVIRAIAAAHGIHPAAVCVKWAVQNGQIVIPFSVKRSNYLANLRCAVQDPLTDGELAQIAQIDKNCRLVKGQVFLWEGASGWENLWDENGVIDRTGWEK